MKFSLLLLIGLSASVAGLTVTTEMNQDANIVYRKQTWGVGCFSV
jgi:hypothetical protein